jgi:flagellar basal-body rod protein FlgF
MNYGLYLSANGAATQSRRLDVVANNLANAQTSGFKRDLATFRANAPYDVEQGRLSHQPHGLRQHTGGVSLHDVVTDFADGPLEQTGGTYDLALTGPGYLRVTDGQRQFLTRDGRLTVNPNGELVTRTAGHRVLDTAGKPILVSPSATDVRIAPDGQLAEIAADGRSVPTARIGLVTPPSNDRLQRIGHGLFADDPAATPAAGNVALHQGYLEASGTNPVSETLQMIEATRGFETNLNMIKYQDESLGRLLQSMAR